MFEDVKVSDLEDRFGPEEISSVTKRDSETDSDDAAEQGLADARGELESIIRVRYRLPATGGPLTPANLALILCDIARYRLYEEQPTKEVNRRYDLAIKHAQEIAQGKRELAGADQATLDEWTTYDSLGGPQSAADNVGVAYKERTRTFTDTSLADYVR